jgi:hypothetical protein
MGTPAAQEPACHALRKNNLARHRVVLQVAKRNGRGVAGLLRKRLIQIALRRSLPLRGACGVQNADAFCRTGVLIVIQDTQNKKGAPMGPLLYLARPERFELPTARFVVSSLSRKLL